MAGRLGHIDNKRRVGHVPNNGLRKTDYRFGLSCYSDFDADRSTNTKTDLAAISLWRDDISGQFFSQPTAGNQPRFIAADANFNNHSSIDFSVDSARFLNHNGIRLSNSLIIAVVFRVVAFPGAQRCTFLSNSAAAGNAITRITGGTTTNPMGVQNGSSTYNLTGDNGDTNPHILIASENNLVVDGVLKDTQTNYGFTDIINRIGSMTAAYSGRVAIPRLLFFDESTDSNRLILLSDSINSEYAIY